MTQKRTISLILVACLLFSMVAFSIGSATAKVISTGIEYNESRLHTMEDTVADSYILSTSDSWVDSDESGDSVGVTSPPSWWSEEQAKATDGFVTDSDANHGQVLKLVSTSSRHFSFDDFNVKQNRKYYIYFDAKSDNADSQAVTLIGINGAGSKLYSFYLTGDNNRNDGVQYFIDGAKVDAEGFKFSSKWQRYGIIIDTSNADLLADINNVYGNDFWSNSIHFQLGVKSATAFFDNLQLIEIDSRPNAVANVEKVQTSVSVRFPKSAIENDGKYLSAGLRFLGTIADDVKDNADEIGFVITPSVVAEKDSAWFDISNGAKSDVRAASCYVKGEKDVLYSSGLGYTAYQVILTGLSTSDGRTSYIQRYSAAMYAKTGDTYTYYALGETSFNEVCAMYYTRNIKSGHIDDGSVDLVVNGVTYKTSLTVGDSLPVLEDITGPTLQKYPFLGWYDETLTTKYTTVPNNIEAVYAVFEGYREYNFELSGTYDPNNKQLTQIVDDPFGGKGKVAYNKVLDKNDNVVYGYYRGIVPGLIEGNSSKGFEFKKGQTYNISFYYRFADSDPSNASTSVVVYAVDPAGVHQNGTKTLLSIPSTTLEKGDGWKLCSFNVTNTTDYKHMYIRLRGGSTTTVYNLYIDNLIICNANGGYVENDAIKLVEDGVMTQTSLKVGDALPTKEKIFDANTDLYFEFDGWYDATLTTKYTNVVSGVNTYFAKYKSYTKISFETGGIFDPNNKYSGTPSGIPVWRRSIDPVNPNNVCIKADLTNNGNNTHFAPPLVEGTNAGYNITQGNKYIISFKYYIDFKLQSSVGLSVRGSKLENIGISGSKTDSIGSYEMSHFFEWREAYLLVNSDNSTLASYPYLIMLAQVKTSEKCVVYIDDIVIKEYDGNTDIAIKTFVNDIKFNDNGIETEIDTTYIGDELLSPTNYYGATFKGWYNETLTVPYSSIPQNNITLYAKYDSSIINFEAGSPFDPNHKQGAGISPYSLAQDPTNSNNTVLKIDLKNNANNTHFGVYKDGYNTTEGYKMTIGNTYTISYKYYIENMNNDDISIQFSGCKEANIGANGGKSGEYGVTSINVEGKWTTVQTTFTYKGTNLTDETNPYLIMLAQQNNDPTKCTATLYIDDIVIKETQAAKTYTRKTVKLGNVAIGSQYKYLGFITRNYEHNIVIPDFNFSYLAMMQIEELVDMLNKASTNSPSFNIVRESKWSSKSNQINIFIGNAAQKTISTSSFTDDDYAIQYSNGNASINAKSTYALALAIAEFGKAFENAADGASLTGTVTGKYSEKINSYSTEKFYRPTFLEDFNGTEINTDVWNVLNGSNIEARGYYDKDGVHHPMEENNWQSMRSAEHTYLKDGNLVIEGAYSEEEEKFYGGMLRSHGKLEYRYGYIEVSCITPHGEGLWTACWLTPHGAGSGLFKSEIDINESFGNARYSAFNMHTWPTTAGGNMGKDHYSLDHHDGDGKRADAGSGKTFANEYHTFGYFWTEDKGVFTVDGQVKYTYQFKSSSKYYTDDIDTFNEKLSLIVSMTVGNPSSGDDPILGADYWNTTNKYIVDYVHIYQVDGQELYLTPPTE